MQPGVSLLRPLDLAVPVSPLGAEGATQRATGAGGGAPLTAEGRVPEACSIETQSEANINQLKHTLFLPFKVS